MKRYNAERLRLDQGGYHRGKYYGNDGSNYVYRVYDNDTNEMEEVRAKTAPLAIKKALAETAFSRKWLGKRFGSDP